MSIRCRCRHAAGLAAMIVFTGCGTVPGLPGLNIPGFGAPGRNQPPLFLYQTLEQTGTNELQLNAAAVDLDGDGLVLTYQQIAGPPAVERTSFRIGGGLSATLTVPQDGTFSFRVVASDGFFDSDVRVTLDVRNAPPNFYHIPPVGALPPQNAAVGEYAVNLAGQISSVSGSPSFAQSARIIIEPPPIDYAGSNPLIVRIESDLAPTAVGPDATGAVRVATSAPRVGRPDDAIAVSMLVDQILLVDGTIGVALADGAACVFRPGAGATGSVSASRVEARLAIRGDVISGTLTIFDTTGLIRYGAAISGTRRPR